MIRRYQPGDRDAVAEICVRTGAAGGDARGLYADELLLPDVYALAYVDLEPQWAFVVVLPTEAVDDDGGLDALRVRDGLLVGYVVATPDTAGFVER